MSSDAKSSQTNAETQLHHCRHRHNHQRQSRGIIYFRPIEPSDRCAIQKLHQIWFPVDYTPDFFDMLCSDTNTTSTRTNRTSDTTSNDVDANYDEDGDDGGKGELQPRRRRRMHQKERMLRHQPKMNSFYTCVACYKELNNDEYETYQSLLSRRQRMLRGKKIGCTPTYLDGSSIDSGDEDTEHHRIICDNGDDEHHQDYLLWESDDISIPPKISNIHDDDESDDEDDNIGCINRWRMGGNNPYRMGGQSTNNTNHDSSDDEGDDDIESGESDTKIYHQTERERVKRFYSNGCIDSGVLNNYDMLSSAIHATPRTAAQQQAQASPSPAVPPPCYNEKGERIVGCIIGSFLPSSQQQYRQSSSPLNDKLNGHKNQQSPPPPPRDETAALLIPNPSLHPTMFYIMTLGTCQEFRRCGLGSKLVNRVVGTIQSQGEMHNQQQEQEQHQHHSQQQHHQKSMPSMSEAQEVGCCGALYLHVITYNKGAIRMYERLGFMRVKKIEGKWRMK
jgi:GNAT superfamily N-acetyltransferase